MMAIVIPWDPKRLSCVEGGGLGSATDTTRSPAATTSDLLGSSTERLGGAATLGAVAPAVLMARPPATEGPGRRTGRAARIIVKRLNRQGTWIIVRDNCGRIAVMKLKG